MADEKKLELFWMDLTESARAKVLEFDPDVPLELTSNEHSMFTIRKKPEGHEGLSDLLKKIISKMADSPFGSEDEGDEGEETFKGVPRKILDEALSRKKAGEDVAGIVMDKESGEYKFLTQAESDQVDKRGDVDTIVMDEDCDCPTCQARRAGEKAHPRKWN